MSPPLTRGRRVRPARIIDLGCGTGASSLILAETFDCPILAVDMDGAALDRLRTKAATLALHDRIVVEVGDFRQDDWQARREAEQSSFDLVWSEGAAFVQGLYDSLSRWSRFASPGAVFVLSENSFLTVRPSPACMDFWAKAYPDMGTIAQNLERVRAAGLAPVWTLPVSQRAAWRNYYAPLERRLQWLSAAEKDLHGDGGLVAGEIALWYDFPGQFGYVYYCLAKSPVAPALTSRRSIE